ncbi:MAG: FG-GAP-like repeat-containing protein [Candidatus Binatia bacterium]
MAIADLDRDGFGDLAVANYGPESQPPFGNTSVLWGDGAGGFSAAQNLRDAITNGIRSADLDRDGNYDLVIWGGDGTRVFWGKGSRSFDPAEVLSEVPAGGVTLADLDADGALDVLVTQYPNAEVAVLYNQGARGFLLQRYPAGVEVNSSPAVGDLDGASGRDVVVTHYWTNTVSVLLATAAGGFAPPVARPGGELPSGVGIGEFTGDAHLDVIYARRGCNDDADASCANDGLTLLIGDGSGGFSATREFEVGEGPCALAVTDVDGNGRHDVVVSNFNSNSVSVLLGQSGGGLAVESPIPVGRGPGDLAVGDLNGDGCADVAVGNWRSATVSVLLVDCRFGGRIRYYSADRPVADVSVHALGPVQSSTISDAAGTFSFAELSEGDWTVEPVKRGGREEAISSLDATYVLQAVAGTRTFTDFQKLACDVTANGSVSAFDAVRILQFITAPHTEFEVAAACASDWGFVPVPAVAANQTLIPPLVSPGTCQRGGIRFAPLARPSAAQDFVGLVWGDCTGNWLPESAAAALQRVQGR